MKIKILAAIGALSLMASSQSMATVRTDIIFPSNPVPLPDLTGSFMDVTYNAVSGAFVASGWTTDYNISDGSGGKTDVGVSQTDSYILSATINNSGAYNSEVLTGGTLTINGAVGDGDTSVTLLTANLVTGTAGTAFGYGDGNNDIFQFRFNVSGGTLADDFGGTGTAGGVILAAMFASNPGNQPFTGSFNNNGGTPGNGSGDIDCFTVPEPTTTACFLLGLGALVCIQRLNQKRSSR
jgi:hypothetical protein